MSHRSRGLEMINGKMQWKLALAAASVALGMGGTANATVNFSNRTWTTGGGATTYTTGSYSGITNSTTMKGEWAQDAAMSTPLTLTIGDTISYDTTLLTTAGWFSDVGSGFIDNTGLYDSAHPSYRGGKVQRNNASTWEFYSYTPSNAQQNYWFIPNNLGDNAHYDWTFDTATHVNLSMTVAGTTVTSGWNITNIADVQAFKTWLWDSEGTAEISNFKQRPGALASTGTQRVWSAASGSYTTGSNWSLGIAPTMGDDALIGNGGTATVDTSFANSGRGLNLDVGDGVLNVQNGGELFAASILRVGRGTATGTVNQTGGWVSVDRNGGADLRIGFDAGATGNYNLSGGELSVDDSLSVGQNGTGVMTMTGGWISHSGFFTVGNNPGANGLFNMSGGTVDMSFGDFEIGDETVGVVNLSGGTFNTPDGGWWFSVGNRPLGSGTATVSGTAQVNTNAVIVGRSATAMSTLNVNGGTINVYNDFNGNNGDLFVGLNGPGQMTVTGGDLQIDDDFIIGHQKAGTVTMSGGVVSKSGWIVLGDEADTQSTTRGTGTLNMTGGTINQTFGELQVGDAGTGTLNLSGGTINVADAVLVANQPGSIGTVTQTGGTLNTPSVTVNSNGVYNYNGGALNTSALQLNGTGKLAMGAGGNKTLKVDTVAIGAAATLDINDDRMVIEFGTNPSPLAAVRQYIVKGRGGTDFANAPWNGTGGISSTAASAVGGGDGISFQVGYVENSFLPNLGLASYTSFGGQAVDSGSLLIRYTKGADANLDGVVNGDDVTIVGADFNAGGTGEWFLGDFDYDGVCDGDDVTVLGALYDPTAPPLSASALTAMYGTEFAEAFERGRALGAAAVPEPGSLALLGLGGLSMLRRRRRHGMRRGESASN